MQNLVKDLSTLSFANANKPVNVAEIISEQKNLFDNDIASIPEGYIEFLHHFNAFAYNGSYLYGITPINDFFLDIFGENMLIFHPQAEENIILGHNECDYLSWNTALQEYQIIDKNDFQVLYTYTSAPAAIRHILKIEDDEHI